MFCKKCHKRVIERLMSNHDVKNKCMCGPNRDVLSPPTEGTELASVESGADTSRRIAKSMIRRGGRHY